MQLTVIMIRLNANADGVTRVGTTLQIWMFIIMIMTTLNINMTTRMTVTYMMYLIPISTQPDDRDKYMMPMVMVYAMAYTSNRHVLVSTGGYARDPGKAAKKWWCGDVAAVMGTIRGSGKLPQRRDARGDGSSWAQPVWTTEAEVAWSTTDQQLGRGQGASARGRGA